MDYLTSSLLFPAGYLSECRRSWKFFAEPHISFTVIGDSLRARVMSFYTMTLMGIGPIGSLIAGGLAQSIGADWTLLMSGVACLAGALYFFLHLDAFRVQACPIYVNYGNLDSVEQCRYR